MARPKSSRPDDAKVLKGNYLKEIDVKEDERLEFLCRGLLEEFGPGAYEAIGKARNRVLAEREAMAISVFEKLLTEEYGAAAKDLVEKAKAQIIVFKEPVNNMAFGEAAASVYGPKVYEVMKKAIRSYWASKVPSLLAQLGITERDAIGALKVLSYLHQGMGDIVEATPKRAVREERYCRYANLFTPLYCEIVSEAGTDGLAHAVNPKLTSHHEKYATKGDDCCRIVIELHD